MTPPRQWKRVSPDHPCAVCGKRDWCGYSEDGTFCVCMRIQEGSLKPTANGGFLHRLADGDQAGDRPRDYSRTIALAGRQPNFAWLATRCQRALPLDYLRDLSARLGIDADVLVRFGVGWSSWHGCFSFPMFDAQGNLIGVHLRRPGGTKLCVTGSKLGLFCPDDLHVVPGGRLVICEGLSDSMALVQMGFDWCIGRPSCSAAVKLLVGYCRRHKPGEAVIIGDRDPHHAGERGANNVASTLLCYVGTVRVTLPPGDFKDIRQALQAGATRADVQAVIDQAVVRRLKVKGGAL